MLCVLGMAMKFNWIDDVCHAKSSSAPLPGVRGVIDEGMNSRAEGIWSPQSKTASPRNWAPMPR